MDLKPLLMGQLAADEDGVASKELVEVIDRLIRGLEELEGAVTSDIQHAINVVYSTYGDVVSVAEKKKSLNKFGDNHTVGTSKETIAEFQGTESNETFVSTNAIDSIVSSSGSDTQQMYIEGHTIDADGDLTFVSQSVTLTGQTPATLTTPLARATRMYVKSSGTFDSPQAALAGTVYVYDSSATTVTSGVPNTASATKILITPGDTQSEKCATAISSRDYWFISYFSATIGNAAGAANYVTCSIEIRDVKNGGVWRPLGREIVLVVGAVGIQEQFSPYLIVPKNHDVRVTAVANSSTAEVHAELGGYLAIITS